MRDIHFHGGPLDGTTGRAGRIINDTYDHVERHGSTVQIHRYKCAPNGPALDARYVATFGKPGSDGES